MLDTIRTFLTELTSGDEKRPFGEDDVLEQVDRQQVLDRERLERSDRHREEEHHRDEKTGDPPPRSRVTAKSQKVGEGKKRDKEQRLGVPRPPVRVHGATLVRARGLGEEVSREVSTLESPVQFR